MSDDISVVHFAQRPIVGFCEALASRDYDNSGQCDEPARHHLLTENSDAWVCWDHAWRLLERDFWDIDWEGRDAEAGLDWYDKILISIFG